MGELARNHRPSTAGSVGRADALDGIPRPAGTDPGPAVVRLDWVGREEAAWLAASPPRGKLRKVPALSVGEGRSANAIIHADNLPAMATLTPILRGRVDLAFLDPPYNATRERWVYPDPILGWFGSVVGAEGEDPLRHDKWLSMMYPRLALVHVLLAESGALFMTLDDHEVHRARVLMDEFFGSENFLANISWEKPQTPGSSVTVCSPSAVECSSAIAWLASSSAIRQGASEGLRACADRLATFHICRFSAPSNRLPIADWHIRYPPIRAASKLVDMFGPKLAPIQEVDVAPLGQAFVLECSLLFVEET